MQSKLMPELYHCLKNKKWTQDDKISIEPKAKRELNDLIKNNKLQLGASTILYYYTEKKKKFQQFFDYNKDVDGVTRVTFILLV